MLLKKNGKKRLAAAIGVIILGIALVIAFNLNRAKETPKKEPEAVQQPGARTQEKKLTKEQPPVTGVVQKEIVVTPKIDYKELDRNEDLKTLMKTRKESLGLDKSLDMIVRSDEEFTIGDTRISMSEILKQAFVKEGEVFEEKIEASGRVRPQKIREFGIYVVQPGDNIWNIHFNILKEYYDHQGIVVAPKADEPGTRGLSSGVGKILKFSETMVIIYNLVEREVDTDIDLLEPLSKIVVYNMAEVFSLLQEINYDNIDRIQFDGKTIWIPTEKS